MTTTKQIRFNGENYVRLASLVEADMSEAAKALRLKQDILDELFTLGVGRSREEGRWRDATKFLPMDDPNHTPLETVLNIVNNYVLRTGEGDMPAQSSKMVPMLLDDALKSVVQKLRPALRDMHGRIDQLAKMIPAITHGGPMLPMASAPLPPSIPYRLVFKGASYQRVWYSADTFVLQRLFQGGVVEEVDKLLDSFDIGRLQALYNYLHKSMRKTLLSMKHALSTLFDQVARVTNSRSQLDDRELIAAEELIPTLESQIDAAMRVLKRIIALEEEFRVEAEEIRARDEARRDEIARQQFQEDAERAKGRGRPRKVRPEDVVPAE